MANGNHAPAIELINVSRRFITPDGISMTALGKFNITVECGEFVAQVLFEFLFPRGELANSDPQLIEKFERRPHPEMATHSHS